MSTFTTPLAIVPLTPAGVVPITAEELDVAYCDGRNWRLLEPFDFASEAIERLIHVPAGFVTDFASTPRIIWPILPPTGSYGKAAVLHDWCYRTPGQTKHRLDADRVLLEAMIALNVPKWARWTVFAGVRIGGYQAYKGTR